MASTMTPYFGIVVSLMSHTESEHYYSSIQRVLLIHTIIRSDGIRDCLLKVGNFRRI